MDDVKDDVGESDFMIQNDGDILNDINTLFGENMRLTSLLGTADWDGTGCTVGLVDETKPIEAMDTAVDVEDTDNRDTTTPKNSVRH